MNSTGASPGPDAASTYTLVVLSSNQPVSEGNPQAISAYGIETCTTDDQPI